MELVGTLGYTVLLNVCISLSQGQTVTRVFFTLS